jgi:hypothetical protein
MGGFVEWEVAAELRVEQARLHLGELSSFTGARGENHLRIRGSSRTLAVDRRFGK